MAAVVQKTRKNSQNIVCRQRKKRVPGMLTVVLLKKGSLGLKTTKKIARVQRPVILSLLTSIWFAMVYSQEPSISSCLQCRYIKWAKILRPDAMTARDRCFSGSKFWLEVSSQPRPAQVSQSAHFFRSIKQAFFLILNEKTRVWRIFWTAHCEPLEKWNIYGRHFKMKKEAF